MSFLKAEWRKLVLVNYEVSPDLLLPYVPAGTELDVWEGKCYVSLVGFLFRNTRVLGLRIPGHVNFEEVNLRFYVVRKVNEEVRRGVVFVREIVPNPAISTIANLCYKENYVTRRMNHDISTKGDEIAVSYSWSENGLEQQFSVNAAIVQQELMRGSEAEFITEHYWGYAKVDDQGTNEYEVTHPRWQIYPVREYEIRVDFERVYGAEFKALNDLRPSSIFLAEGSEITVESKSRIN